MKKYKDQKLDELRSLCKERGIDAIGKKEILVSRLMTFDNTKSKNRDMFTPTAELELEPFITQTVRQPSKTNFYLQIKSANLSNYFNFGCIYPLALEESEIYKKENRAKDILSIFEDYIVVGKTPFNHFDNTDVLIELVLNGVSVGEYENSGLFYVSEPIPVSRVKTIYFRTNVVRTNFLSSIKTFPDSFIPSSMCQIISSEDERPKKMDFDKIKLPQNTKLPEWKNKLDVFDKTIGLFAFMKNIGVIYAEKENRFENYTEGFFSTLNLINPIKAFSNYKENSFLRPLLRYRNLEIKNVQRIIFKLAIERLYANGAFDIKTAIEILEATVTAEGSRDEELFEIKEIIKLFKQLDKLTISYKGLLQNDVLKKNLPVLALLFLSRFSNKSRQNTDKQAVRNSFIENEFAIPMNVAEYILGFLGLYYGYKNMIKEDTNLKFSDKNFELLSRNSQSIKFKLESYLDRFIVESSFQYAVKETVLNDPFEFLNWSQEPIDEKPTSASSSWQFDYIDKSFVLLGQKILVVHRQDKTEKVFEKITKQYSDKIESTSYLAAFLIRYLHIDKWQMLELLKKNKGRYPMDELEKIIDLDSKNRKNQG